MKSLHIRFSVAICASTTLLSSCHGAQSPIDASLDAPITAQQSRGEADYAVLHSFKAGEGVHPASGLVAEGTTLYGTTIYGGYDDRYCPKGCGTVYAISIIGKTRLIYTFANRTTSGQTDGRYPLAAVTGVNATLYGTTIGGGYIGRYGCDDTGCGLVFSVTRSGNEVVVYRFTGGFHDGSMPETPLVNVNGALFGSTRYGGPYGDGTIFSCSTTGSETILYDFIGRPHDGAAPSSLVDVDGTLYGTTTFGGAKNLGTVFSVTTSGTERVLHSFKGGAHDGALPRSLIDVDGTLFGTTAAGGKSTTCLGGCGTLFAIGTTARARFHVVHSFSTSDGSDPGGLTTMNGGLYGVASSGGDYNRGTLFTASLNGVTHVLHSFGAQSDGKDPVGQLLVVGETLYGTTWAGGSENKGTVYRLKP